MADNERKYLKELTTVVQMHLRDLDAEMQKPSDNQRGKRIAILCNALEIANDRARHFGLGLPL